jgi:hypothetical protein
MSGVSRIFLNDGTATLPTLTFTNASDSGVYYAPSNNLGFQSVDFGARFVTANRAVMRAFRSGPSRLDFIVGSTITMSLVEQGIQIGSNGTSEPGVAQSVTNVNLYGDLIPPFGTNGVHSIGYPGASWNLMGAAEFIVTSDVRLKDIKGDIPSALAAVQSLSPKLASWKDKTRPGTFPSFSAQDVAATLDKRYGTHLAVYRKDKDAWGVDYDKLTPILWQAVKELNAKVDALEAKLAKHQH